MGKRFYLGLTLLMLFCLLGLGASWSMHAIHKPAAAALKNAAQLALDGDLSQAEKLAENARSRWSAYWQFTAAIADHSPMDDIDQLFSEMQVYAQDGDSAHFAACCAQLSTLVEGMAAAHCTQWWNFL